MLWLGACFFILISMVLLRCTKRMRGGYRRARRGVITVEAVILAGSFIVLPGGTVAASVGILTGIVPAAGVIAIMMHHESKE
jgi:hypothetical protein